MLFHIIWGFSKFFDILRATPSATGPFWLLGIAIWGAWCLLFDIVEAYFGSTLGAILAPRNHPGGPLEQQVGLEVVDNRICLDLGVILGPAYISFWDAFFFPPLISKVIFLSISELELQRLGFPNRRFRVECIAKKNFHGNRFLWIFESMLCRFLEALEAAFLIFWALKTRLKIEGFLVCKRILRPCIGGGNLVPIWALWRDKSIAW